MSGGGGEGGRGGGRERNRETMHKWVRKGGE